MKHATNTIDKDGMIVPIPQRNIEPKVCPMCTEVFTPRKGQKYCSLICYHKAQRGATYKK